MKARYLSLVLTLPLTLAAWPSHAGTWYYCDPLRAYYPSVQTCPVPWHPVEAANPGPTPRGVRQRAAAQPADTAKGYQDGLKAREDWWSWRVSLDGSYRQGADYWAAHRKLAKPGTCDEPIGVTDPDPTWSQGCEDARQRLETVDKNMKGEPGFRRGWVAFKPSQDAIRAARKARADAPADAGPDPAAQQGDPAQGGPAQDQPPQDQQPQGQQPQDTAPPAGSPPPPEGVPPAQNGY